MLGKFLIGVPICYIFWFICTHKYATLREQVPWRRTFLRILMIVDTFFFSYLMGMRRRAYFSMTKTFVDENSQECECRGLSAYRTNPSHSNGTIWAASPHHLLIPGFVLAFHLEMIGVHAEMGVKLDEIFTAAASVLFYVPLLRDIVITLGGRVASPEVLQAMKLFAVAPGGIHEMINQKPGVDRAFVRSGFLRFALQKKLDVGVLYLFDENEAYQPIEGLPSFFTKFQHFLHRWLGIGLPLWRGRWGIPFNPLPLPVEYVCGVGRPILIKDVAGMEESAALQWLQEAYEREVKRLFAELKEETGRRKAVTLVVERLERRASSSEVSRSKLD